MMLEGGEFTIQIQTEWMCYDYFVNPMKACKRACNRKLFFGNGGKDVKQ